jgi:hypothetical protein
VIFTFLLAFTMLRSNNKYHKKRTTILLFLTSHASLAYSVATQIMPNQTQTHCLCHFPVCLTSYNSHQKNACAVKKILLSDMYIFKSNAAVSAVTEKNDEYSDTRFFFQRSIPIDREFFFHDSI